MTQATQTQGTPLAGHYDLRLWQRNLTRTLGSADPPFTMPVERMVSTRGYSKKESAKCTHHRTRFLVS